MDNTQKFDIPQCYVVVRKLTLEEISRIAISPFHIGHKCGRCRTFAHYGPKCTTCSVSYHYECAIVRKTCCGLNILPTPRDHAAESPCPRCKQIVEYGPQCSTCLRKYHSYCLTPYDQCCQFNLCEPSRRRCGKCEKEVQFGPKCPFCLIMYHSRCVDEALECCGIKFSPDVASKYKCRICFRSLGLGCPMCQYCGALYHTYCANRRSKSCCGRHVSFEMCLIPSFSYMTNYFNKFVKRKAELQRLEEMVITHTHTLRSMIREARKSDRAKRKKSISCQTNVLDTIEIVSVKTELEEEEKDLVDVSESPPPPLLAREGSVTPEPSSSSSCKKPDSCTDGEDTLKNLFNFLYNMVKKFPPPLQTQVKIDLFKTVTEAEMKLQCDMVENGVQHSAK